MSFYDDDLKCDFCHREYDLEEGFNRSFCSRLCKQMYEEDHGCGDDEDDVRYYYTNLDYGDDGDDDEGWANVVDDDWEDDD